MNVEKVKSNQNVQAQYLLHKGQKAQDTWGYTPSFNGKYRTDDIRNELMKYMPQNIKVMLFLKKHIGEVQNIIINSIGTGLIAPIFIKWNPLSKTDEDTRTYSAWRQPISAALAILTQVGATIPFNNKVKSMANQGKLGADYNMTPYNDLDYLKKIVRKQHPDYSKNQINDQAIRLQKAQHEELLKNLRTQNAVFMTQDGRQGRVKMNPQRLKETLEATVQKLIEEEKTEKNANSMTKRNLRIQRSEFYRNNAETCNKHFDELDKIFNSGDIEKVKKDLANKIKSMKAEKADKELIKLTREIYQIGSKSNDNGLIKYMTEKVERARGYVRDYSAMSSSKEVIARVDESIRKRGVEIEDTLRFFDKIKNAVAENKTVHEIEQMFIKEQKNNQRLQGKGICFAEKVAEQLKKQTKASLNGYKQIGGIIVSLITLFISCPLLNWIYPRFMAAVFPNLSNGKQKKDTENLIELTRRPVFEAMKEEVRSC